MSKDGFSRVKFGDFVACRNERYPNNGTYPLYSLTIKDGVTPKTDRYEREFLVTDKSVKKYKIIKTGDLVFNPSNLRWGAIATSLVPFPVLASPIYEVFYPKDSNIVDPYFLGILASSSMLMNEYLSKVEGTLVERTALKKDDFLEIKVDIPSLPEQKKIVEILFGIDKTISEIIIKKAHIEKTRKSLIQNLTKGLNFKGLRKSSNTEFGLIPSHWDCMPLPECGKLENNKRKPIKEDDRRKMRGKYPYHGATKIQDYISEYSFEGNYTLIGEDGDHFSKYNLWEMAQYATGRFNVSNHAHVIGGTSKCHAKWFYYSMLHRDLTLYLTRQGATRFKLSKASLEEIPVLCPPINEQVKMINIFDNFSNIINLLEKKIIKLSILKKGISSQLLSGRKRVNI